MKTIFLSTLCGVSILLVVGCGFRAPKYEATAIVMFEASSPDALTAQPDVMIAAEVESIEALAASAQTDPSQEFTVTPRGPNTIVVTVTAADPREAADVCNSIADTYAAREDDGVSRVIVEKAVPPESSI